jgi:hypothetical protein
MLVDTIKLLGYVLAWSVLASCALGLVYVLSYVAARGWQLGKCQANDAYMTKRVGTLTGDKDSPQTGE